MKFLVQCVVLYALSLSELEVGVEVWSFLLGLVLLGIIIGHCYLDRFRLVQSTSAVCSVVSSLLK